MAPLVEAFVFWFSQFDFDWGRERKPVHFEVVHEMRFAESLHVTEYTSRTLFLGVDHMFEHVFEGV